MKKKQYIFILFVALLQTGYAQLNFTANASKKKLGVNERLKVSYTIDKQGADNFSAPNFNNFKVVAGPFQSSNFSMINGKTSYEQTLTYTLQPTKKGNFTIAPATITYKGKTIKSNPLKITVTKAVDKPRDPNDIAASDIAKENVHLVVDVSKTNPYVGESILVVYKLYVDMKNGYITNEVQSKPPTFDGFWNQNIEIKNLTERKGTYKDKPMSYYIIRKDILIPQRAGNLTITPVEIDLDGVVYLNKIDFFGNRLKKTINFTLKGGKKTIRVKALPEVGKPSDFNGAVGDFNFRVTTNKTVLNANESAQVAVKVGGIGNLKLISLPKIDAPKGIELYQPEHQESIRVTERGLSGTIADTYTIVPQFKGKFKIPALSFSYFNPKEEKYFTLNSEPIILNVPNGAEMTEDNLNKDKPIEITAFQPIKTKTTFISAKAKKDFFQSKLFYLLLLIPLLSIPFGIYLGNKKRERENDTVGNKRRKASRLAKKYLGSAKKLLGKKEAFYEALEKALHNYLKAKLHIETSEMSKDRIEEILKDKNVNTQTIKEFIKVLNDCEFARYAPSSNTKMEQDYQNAVNVITTLDKVLS
ncbi:MAG TPA: protein BatD [Flavobacteriia bacterium]|nr:protein BatD [Flavobacteriia bacterium]